MTTTARCRAATTAATERRGERGQILPLLVLTMATMAACAVVAVTFGQALVRRQQAQMVVDAAAFAGAAEQAKGMNTIARINQKQFEILNGIVLSQKTPFYMDSDSTTWGRIWWYGLLDDWANDNWKNFQPDVFKPLNDAIDRVNLSYRVYGIPKQAADRIVEQNFSGDANALFRGETPVAQGVVVWTPDVIKKAQRMVELTEPQTYKVGGARIYTPYFGNYAVTCDPMYGLNVYCVFLKERLFEVYQEANYYFDTVGVFDRPEYEIGKFYNNEAYDDVRFSYFLELPGAKPIFGGEYFREIPNIVVMATAKPYGGHMGAEYIPTKSWLPPDPFGIWFVGQFEQHDRAEISTTYRAKLIPVRTLEKKQLAIQRGDSDLGRYLSVLH